MKRIVCRSCGVEEGRVSPECAEHERRCAELAHLHAVASGLPCDAYCPVDTCVAHRAIMRSLRWRGR